VHFVGRLATYKYYNMDQVVAQALALYRKLTGEKLVVRRKRDELSTLELPAARAVGGNGKHH
jgi:UDP-galactopyranose mutase